MPDTITLLNRELAKAEAENELLHKVLEKSATKFASIMFSINTNQFPLDLITYIQQQPITLCGEDFMGIIAKWWKEQALKETTE